MFKIAWNRRGRDKREVMDGPRGGGPLSQRLQAGVRKGDSIRWKLALAFLIMSCFVTAFIGGAIAIQYVTIERAAQLEALHVAELIADVSRHKENSGPHLQEYVARLNTLHQRGVVIVDAGKKGLADADPDEVGDTFNHDPGNQVAKTISDGRNSWRR
jgi:hypothetical protein